LVEEQHQRPRTLHRPCRQPRSEERPGGCVRPLGRSQLSRQPQLGVLTDRVQYDAFGLGVVLPHCRRSFATECKRRIIAGVRQLFGESTYRRGLAGLSWRVNDEVALLLDEPWYFGKTLKRRQHVIV